MRIVQEIVLPVLFLAAVALALRARRATGWRRRTPVIAAVAVLDVWLWSVALQRPLGPHFPLVYLLTVLHVVGAFVAIKDLTGFAVTGRGRSSGRYRSVRDPGGYNPYRGD